MALLFGASGIAPAGQSSISNQVNHRQQGQIGDFGDTGPLDAERRLHALNEQRHKTMVSDANKLLQLAKELDAEVAVSNAGTLTPAELHKVVAIEKLAHGVREKMVLSYGGEPQLRVPTYSPGLPGGPPLGPE